MAKLGFIGSPNGYTPAEAAASRSHSICRRAQPKLSLSLGWTHVFLAPARFPLKSVNKWFLYRFSLLFQFVPIDPTCHSDRQKRLWQKEPPERPPTAAAEGETVFLPVHR